MCVDSSGVLSITNSARHSFRELLIERVQLFRVVHLRALDSLNAVYNYIRAALLFSNSEIIQSAKSYAGKWVMTE